MAIEKCVDCRYFRRRGDDPASTWGTCRRYPPAARRDGTDALWPKVDLAGWCGEFEIDPAVLEARSRAFTEALMREVQGGSQWPRPES